MIDDERPKSDQAAPSNKVEAVSPPHPRPPSKVDTEPHEIDTQRENRSVTESARPPRDPLRLTDWIIAIFTIVIAIATWYQGHIAKQAADDSGKQADKIIVADQRLATANERFATAMENTVTQSQGALDRTLAEMQKQSFAMQEAAKATGAQAAIGKNALNESIESANQDRRPWVGLQSLQCNSCKLAADGTFTIGNLAALVVNTGKTPAIDMIVDSSFITNKGSAPIPTYDEIESQEKIAEKRAESIPPNLPPALAAEWEKSIESGKRRMARPREILAPNAGREIIVIASFQEKKNIPAMIEDQAVTYGLGKITYYDTSHAVEYATTFCVMNDLGEVFRFCPTGNEMK